MENDLRQLYQDMILEHARKPRNFGVLNTANRHAHGNNPLCGDDITVHLELADDDTVRDIKFEGHGCAIHTAAASVMTGLAKGKKVSELTDLFKTFRDEVMEEDNGEQGAGEEGAGEAGLPKKLKVFTGVKAYPMRVKCATLAWHTLTAALEGEQDEVTTE